jgi:Triose-phosphate Transporter family
VRRVIVIVASVIVFRNPMSMQSKISTAVALLGVFFYSQAKRHVSKSKKAQSQAPKTPESLTTPIAGEQQG